MDSVLLKGLRKLWELSNWYQFTILEILLRSTLSFYTLETICSYSLTRCTDSTIVFLSDLLNCIFHSSLILRKWSICFFLVNDGHVIALMLLYIIRLSQVTMASKLGKLQYNCMLFSMSFRSFIECVTIYIRNNSQCQEGSAHYEAQSFKGVDIIIQMVSFCTQIFKKEWGWNYSVVCMRQVPNFCIRQVKFRDEGEPYQLKWKKNR